MSRRSSVLTSAAIVAAGGLLMGPVASAQNHWTLVAWNDLGMHCMDGDYSVFSILPPFNNVNAQVLDENGELVTAPGGVAVTYEATADGDGSINRTSAGKTNFWEFVDDLFGVSPPVDEGLTGSRMPGAANVPQPSHFDGTWNWFSGDGIPLTPYDDAAAKNFYPLMRLVARDGGGALLAETSVVLPVSDEMDCSLCHASGSGPPAEPAGGWVFDPDPQRDFRLNVLLLHDDLELGNSEYQAALATAGYNPGGLYLTVIDDGRAVLCATCHATNALPGTGLPAVSAHTSAVHARHANVVDPTTGMTLDDSNNRNACYTCHPGSTTQCLRGAMGRSVASDGTLAIQCQSCHGSMSRVGSPAREGWFEEPDCQSCHTGTAVANNGQIRYTSVFDEFGDERVAVDQTFATNENTPLPGLSLYRFSSGHGALQCSACHGSTHAVFPSSHASDNLQSLTLQGHEGTLVECLACHPSMPETFAGGPHGLHPLGQSWINDHKDAAEDGGAAACRLCHGADYRGTVLSYSQRDWTAHTEFGDKFFFRGSRIGCYACHNGPTDEEPNPNRRAVAGDLAANTEAGVPVMVTLTATDPDGDPLELRIVSQPAFGTVGLVGAQATYFPPAEWAGVTTFNYAAWDGAIDSNLATVTLTVEGCVECLFADGFESGDTTAWSAVVP
jgi:hypothetical protein